MSIKEKLIRLFTYRHEFRAVNERLDNLEKNTRFLTGLVDSSDNHLITLCRLFFITPDRLYEEVNNIKANNEYIHKLLIVKKREENGQESISVQTPPVKVGQKPGSKVRPG